MDDIRGRVTKDGIRIYEDADFAGMREAGRIAAVILDDVGALVQPGVLTADLDDFIRTEVARHGAVSATIGYKGYQHASCISVNHVVCHGIPTERKQLKAGDIVNIDVTVIKDGYFGDTSKMFFVGKPAPFAERLVRVTRECLFRGIDVVRPGARLGDIGHAIQTHAEANHFSVVREFCGHGIGQVFHEEPQVLHYGRPGTLDMLREGMTCGDRKSVV